MSLSIDSPPEPDRVPQGFELPCGLDARGETKQGYSDAPSLGTGILPDSEPGSEGRAGDGSSSVAQYRAKVGIHSRSSLVRLSRRHSEKVFPDVMVDTRSFRKQMGKTSRNAVARRYCQSHPRAADIDVVMGRS
jgi:hypothetical protein